MDSQIENLEEKLKSLLGQLQAECGIFERLVYKNKNQHRRSSYFQYLLKVRRDLRLLQSVKLEELLGSCFQVITGKKPKQKVYLLESLKRRKCEGTEHNFMERLLGAARLMSLMVEPMLKAATEVSTLLARSFFMGFSLTILALLARLCVVVQQILLDVVSIFNTVSFLSQKKHSLKINQEGIDVYREFYPVNDEYITLECVWNADKFVLLERSHKSEKKSQEEYSGSDFPIGNSALWYQSIESFIGDDKLDSVKVDAENAAVGGPIFSKDKTNLFASPSIQRDDENQVDSRLKAGEIPGTLAVPDQMFTSEAGSFAASSSLPSSNLLKSKSGTKKVAFVSVKRPATATSNSMDLHIKEPGKKSGDGEDKFYSLLTGGNLKDSPF